MRRGKSAFWLCCAVIAAVAVGILLGGAMQPAYPPFMKHHAPAPKIASSMVYIEMGCFVEKGPDGAPVTDDDGDPVKHCGIGSGVDIGHGFVLTAAHVADDPAYRGVELKVVDSEHRDHKTEVLWVNHNYDVALLRIADPSTVASSHLSGRLLTTGEKLIFQGNPFDIKAVTTWGRVAKDKIEAHGPWAAVNIVDGIIAPGMSGGPVFDRAGDVVGINVGIFAHGSALGVIVPGHVINMLLGHV